MGVAQVWGGVEEESVPSGNTSRFVLWVLQWWTRIWTLSYVQQHFVFLSRPWLLHGLHLNRHTCKNNNKLKLQKSRSNVILSQQESMAILQTHSVSWGMEQTCLVVDSPLCLTSTTLSCLLKYYIIGMLNLILKYVINKLLTFNHHAFSVGRGTPSVISVWNLEARWGPNWFFVIGL